jgi:type IV pilus assembly protein PilX
MHATAHAMTPARRQRGVVLVIALIVLVAMTLAGLAMMRSVTGGILVAGNIGFKRAATAAADFGIEAARDFLLKAGAGLKDAKEGYVLTWDPSFSPTTHTWTNSTSREALADTAVASHPEGIKSVRYVIHRLCETAGAVDSRTCVTDLGAASNSTMSGAHFGAHAMTGATAVIYRVTVQVVAAKGATSYVQALVY